MQVDRAPHVIALHEVDAELAQQVLGLLVLDELGDGLLPEAGGRVHEALEDHPVGARGRALAHELAVDLEDVERQLLEVDERAEPGAEVVEREPAADLGERTGELTRLLEVADGGGLGDLEDELGGSPISPNSSATARNAAGSGTLPSGSRIRTSSSWWTISPLPRLRIGCAVRKKRFSASAARMRATATSRSRVCEWAAVSS